LHAAFETPTRICEVQTTSSPQNCVPSAWGTRIPHSSSGVMDLSAAYLAHDLLSGFYGFGFGFMARGAAINPTGDVIERPPALPWDSLHQLFGIMGNMNSGNLISAAAGSPSSELSRSRESESGIGGTTPPDMHWSVSQLGTQRGQRGPTPPPHPSVVRGAFAQHRACIRQDKTRRHTSTSTSTTTTPTSSTTTSQLFFLGGHI
jgi:hypothetical protein